MPNTGGSPDPRDLVALRGPMPVMTFYYGIRLGPGGYLQVMSTDLGLSRRSSQDCSFGSLLDKGAAIASPAASMNISSAQLDAHQKSDNEPRFKLGNTLEDATL